MALILTTVVFLLIPVFTFAQYDTIYLNRSFKPTDKSNYSYYRIIEPKDNKLFIIKDYYKTGQLQMYGVSEAPDDKHFIKRVVRYNIDGSIESICDHKTYKDGWITFYNKQNIKTASLWCINNKKDGKAIFYYPDGKIFKEGSFKNDAPYSGNIPVMFGLSGGNISSYYILKKGERIGQVNLFANGKKAADIKITDDLKVLSARFYFPDGKNSGECVYKHDLPYNGVCTEFTEKLLFSFKPSVIRYRTEYQEGIILWRETYLKDTRVGFCTYKDNYPYQGVLLEDGRNLNHYVNGRKIGLQSVVYKEKVFLTYESDDTETKNGHTVFINNQDNIKYKGSFRNNYPDSGYVFHNNELAFYKNGVKNGKSVKFNTNFDTVTIDYYSLGQLVNVQNFQYPALGVLTCEFKDGKPFEGDHLTSERNFKITEYKNGEILSIKEYRKDSLVLLRYEEVVPDGKIIQYKKDGSNWLNCQKQNSKPYDGSVLINMEILNYKEGRLNGEKILYNHDFTKIRKIETYLNDTLNGAFLENDYNGKELSNGIYLKGKPHQGRFKSGNETVSYKNGKKNGISKVDNPNFKSEKNYINDELSGNSRFIVVSKLMDNSISYLDTQYYKRIKDTFYFEVDYVDGKPFNGVDVSKNAISTFKNGKLNGTSIYWNRSIFEKPFKVVQFADAVPHGQSVVFYDGISHQGLYDNGNLMQGFNTLEILENSNNFEIPEYYNGVAHPYDKFIKSEYPFSQIHIRNGKPYHGVIMKNKEMPFIYEYNQGKLIKSYLYLDLSKAHTEYDGLNGVTKDENLDVLYHTYFSDSSLLNGKVEYLNKSSYLFKNGFLSDGCIEFENIGEKFFNQLTYIKFCQEEKFLSITKKNENKSIYHIDYIETDGLLPIPFHLSMGYMYSFEYIRGIKFSRNTYLTSNNQLIASMLFNDGEKSGVYLEQDKNLFNYISFDDGYDKKLTFEELMQMLKK